eukprot:CAMPEP_0174385672 /NCGR_PEP_ID=MMETSP0811_2-20130205/126752_1 /TAXON_ID=73025 ORGANISM="Eutreptiella gymnastica-like, Strain CCMP1594" /NCGR_SAMPLE_ID=MMETSP0811_2 /ASSEMBLY_ACC=CAM_ASM_000667 /LENGTH=39 /DNA_ID= /DNA_START= /DNA_END= /DNA_ORIENTATION=
MSPTPDKAIPQTCLVTSIEETMGSLRATSAAHAPIAQGG